MMEFGCVGKKSLHVVGFHLHCMSSARMNYHQERHGTEQIVVFAIVLNFNKPLHSLIDTTSELTDTLHVLIVLQI